MQTGPWAKSLAFALTSLISAQYLRAQGAADNTCHRPSAGSVVAEPEDLRSQNGELTVDLRIQNYIEADGSIRYCYTTADGKESPNLRLHPGDLLILNLKNDLTDFSDGTGAGEHHHAHADTKGASDPCISGSMTPTS